MLQSEWPETRALGEVFRRRLYHLTVARDRSVFEEIRAELSAQLPVDAIVQEALLLEIRSQLDVRTVGRFALGT
jgi:hypothetical protein